MSTFEMLLAIWGVITAGLICAMIYRGALETHEDDQIFLDAAGDTRANEQRELVARLERLQKPITGLMVLSGGLLAVIAGMWLWQGFKSF